MNLNKSLYILSSVLVTSVAFAQENQTNVTENNKLNLDVIAGAGYTNYGQISVDGSDSRNSTYNGFNVNASALYSIMETNMGSPVVGLGLNYTRAINENDTDNSFSTLAAIANAGFKFKPTSQLAIFTLGNLGYGLYNSDKYKSVNSPIKNHFLYGASVIGTYEVVKDLSAGLGFTYNRHSYKQDTIFSSNVSFNEYSANIYISYNL